MDDTVAQTDIGDGLLMPQTPREQAQDFTRQVAGYFGAYVNGALSSQGLPLRAYGETYSDGLIRKVSLEKYPQLNKNLYKNFATGLGQQTFVVTQNKYTVQPDDRVLYAARENVAKLTQNELMPLFRTLAARAKSTLIEPVSSQDDAINRLLIAARQTIEQELVVPHVLSFSTVNINVKTDNRARQSLASLRDAASSRLFDASRETLRHIFIAYRTNESYVSEESLIMTLAEAMTVEQIKDSLESCIDDQYVGDAYQQIYGLHRSVVTSGNLDLYAYFGELLYESESFPLFYTKVMSKHALPSVTLSFENRIFVNKQAIEYVVRSFAARMNQPVDLAALNIPRVIYSAEEMEVLQRLVAHLRAIFKLPDDIALAKTALQETTNHLVTMTNRLYLYVETPTGSAIADDYAEILRNGDLHKKTRSYFDTLLIKPSGRFVEEISESWVEKSYFERLLPTIPLQVNDEQRQVLMALARASADRIVVDSAESTGKRHLIKASIFTALTKGQTVLVVGTKTDLGRGIHDEIGATLLQASGAHGHNPVLDLYDADVLDRIDDQVITDTTANVRLVESKLSELATTKKRKKQALKDGFAQFVQNAETINLHEIEQSLVNERRFADRDWIADEPIDAIGDSIQRLHRSLQYVRSSDAGYLMSYVEVNQQKSIEDFVAAYKEYEQASRNVHSRLPKFIVRYRKLLPDQKKQLQENLAYTQSNYRQFMRILRDQPASSWLPISDSSTFQEVAEHTAVFDKVLSIAREADKNLKYGDRTALLRELDNYNVDPSEIVEAFDTYVEQIATLKSKLFGFSGRMLVVENLNKQLIKSLPSFGLPDPEKQAENMQVMSEFVRFATEELAAAGLPVRHWKNVVHILLSREAQLDEIREILDSLNTTARFDFISPFKIHDADNLLANITLLEYATELNRVYREFPKLSKLVGLTTINHLLVRPHEFTARVGKLSRDVSEANQLNEAKNTIKAFVDEFPEASKRLGVRFSGGNLEVMDDTFANTDAEYIKEYVSHKKKERDVRAFFDDVVTDSFATTAIEYQQILGVELQYELNGNLLKFVKEQGSFVGALSNTLKERRKLSPAEAAKLVKLFPVVAGDIHRLSAIFPLNAEPFDLVILDTADTMTIAEAMPAVLRAKKVLVVGDSAQAKGDGLPFDSAMGNLYNNRLGSALRLELGNESADSKNGIITKQETTFIPDLPALTFFTAYANYELTLKKQYGTYEELASLGNKYYYHNAPISLMSRTTPVADIVRFSQVKPEDGQVSRFTNSAEIDVIIQQLQLLKEQGFGGTIGIVTPFAEQAALLQKELDECVITDWFERRQLKVMTFDGKRQQTRDYTFYSMVASTSFNELSQKLPSAIAFNAFPNDSRSHRLLAGFSGNRHAVHIVHSLPIEDYGGATTETLKHYASKLRGSVVVKGAATDVLQAAETSIGRAFEKTNFAKKYEDRLSFTVKYPFVNYIKPLSPDYYKAPYKMFFLVMIDTQPIVIEFDDFKERFLQNNKDELGAYLTPDDIYGYKLLEGYGYRFLRLNKFNIGNDPVRTLDMYLNDLMKTPSWPSDNGFVV